MDSKKPNVAHETVSGSSAGAGASQLDPELAAPNPDPAWAHFNREKFVKDIRYHLDKWFGVVLPYLEATASGPLAEQRETGEPPALVFDATVNHGVLARQMLLSLEDGTEYEQLRRPYLDLA